mgnify:CR=1 FL=1|jgi:hypothetical protein
MLQLRSRGVMVETRIVNKGNKMDNTCKSFVEKLQQYIDKDLPKEESMSMFLHARDCVDCSVELDRLESICSSLNELPEIQSPADFDQKILSSIPYNSYKAMADIRQPRVPVILDEEIIPGIVRSPLTRGICSSIAVLSIAGLISGWLDSSGMLIFVAGAMPESLVRLQSIFRKKYFQKVERDAA